MSLEKEKIKSISNTEKALWLRVTPTNKSLEIIDKIIRKFNHIGLEPYDETGKEINLDYHNFINDDIKYFHEEESIYLIFTTTHINIILLKDSKLFKKLEKDFMENFLFNEDQKKWV